MPPVNICELQPWVQQHCINIRSYLNVHLEMTNVKVPKQLNGGESSNNAQ